MITSSPSTVYHADAAKGPCPPARVSEPPAAPYRGPRLIDRVRQAIRTRHYSLRTEEAHLNWIVRFIRFHRMRHPEQMGKGHVQAFLSHPATGRNVSASTQNQAHVQGI